MTSLNQSSYLRWSLAGRWALFGIVLAAGCSDWQGSPTSQPAQAHGARPAGTPANPPAGEPTPAEVARMIEPNVLGVSCFYDPFNPWLWNNEHTQVRGVKIGSLFLLGPNSTGVFGDGTIHPRLYVAGRDDQGKVQYRLIKEWTFNVDQAMPFRAKRRTRWGWGYALFLPWGDLNLAGRDVRLTVTFERADGVVISGSKKDFKVPKPEQG